MSIAEKLTLIAENGQKVFDAGKRAEYDRFWDIFQDYGKRKAYANSFGGAGWTDALFKPKYDIETTDAYMMFRNTAITDLTNAGIRITFKPSNMQYTFQYASQLTHIGVLDLSTMTVKGLDSTFYSCAVLHTIDKIILNESGTNTFGGTFTGCHRLQNIVFEGVIGNNIAFPVSPLSTESMNSIFSCLKDYSAEGGTHTVTFKADRETMLTDSQKAAATEKGWTLVWA